MKELTIKKKLNMLAKRVPIHAEDAEVCANLLNQASQAKEEYNKARSPYVCLVRNKQSKRIWKSLNSFVPEEQREVLWCRFLREKRAVMKSLKNEANKAQRKFRSISVLYKALTKDVEA